MKPECCSRKIKIMNFSFLYLKLDYHDLTILEFQKSFLPLTNEQDSLQFKIRGGSFSNILLRGFVDSIAELTDTDLIKQCIDECTARIEIGLHYQIPYPRPIHLPPMGLIPLRGRGLRSQEKLRKLSKPVYLKSHDEVS
ncbi:LYR motif-containing protein 1 isoform X1 [Diceros bicornis minor]|uniref:LYR motif-containing protein 1 isoform X1 n=1 Tax=Diceros bicornis minor TaxID=77932 RepID=UPI0026EA3999|nr:LYR motif-containing protein 1 isoform X1 [Diceros bicornis minor]